MAVMYAPPASAVRLGTEPQLASWDRAGHPSQVRLGRFLDHVAAIVAPIISAQDNQIAVELVVGLPADVPLAAGGRDLDNYLFPVAQRLGPGRIAAMFGSKVHGPSTLAACPAIAVAPTTAPQFSARISGSYERREWKEQLRGRLALRQVGTLRLGRGPVRMDIAITTGAARNWANLWKPLIDSFGPILGEDSSRPFHPNDDRITSLGLHHGVETGLGHDVVIDAWWTAA